MNNSFLKQIEEENRILEQELQQLLQKQQDSLRFSFSQKLKTDDSNENACPNFKSTSIENTQLSQIDEEIEEEQPQKEPQMIIDGSRLINPNQDSMIENLMDSINSYMGKRRESSAETKTASQRHSETKKGDSASKQIRSLEMRLAGTREAMKQLEKELKDKNQTIQSLQIDLAKKNKIIDQLNIMQKQVKEPVQTINQESFQELKKLNKEYEKRTFELETQLRENKKYMQRLQELNQQLLLKLKDYEQQNQSNDIEELAHSLQKYEDMIKQLHSELKGEKERYNQLNDKHNELKKSSDIFIANKLDSLQEFLELGNNFQNGIKQPISNIQLKFNSTKTSQLRLGTIFQQCHKKVSEQIQPEQGFSFAKLVMTSAIFIDHLNKTELYKSVKLGLLPGPKENSVMMIFEIEDKSPYYMSLQNEFGRDGSQLTFKLGLRNLLKQEDKFQFEYDKNLSQGGQNWLLSLKHQTVGGIPVDFEIKQSQSTLQQFIDENAFEIGVRTQYFGGDLNLSYGQRSNTISSDGTLQGEYLRTQYLNSLQNLPTEALKLNYTKTIFNTKREKNGVVRGSQMRGQFEVGAPFGTTFPFLKFSINNQVHIPLQKYRKIFKPIKKTIKNSSLELNLNYGAIFARKVMINDFFRNQTFRSFSNVNYLWNDQFLPFVKLDAKLNIHMIDAIRAAKVFYYGSIFAIGRDLPLRGSYGVGVGMPIGNVNLEAIFSLGVWKQQFDKVPQFQVRISVDD